MNTPAVRPPARPPAPSDSPPGSQVAQVISGTITPYRRALNLVAELRQADWVRIVDNGDPLYAGQSESAALAARRLEQLPTNADYQRMREILAAMYAPAPQLRARNLIAMMLESFRSTTKDGREIFYETLMWDIEDAGHSEPVIAAACEAARRTLEFRPSTAKILDLCETARAAAWVNQRKIIAAQKLDANARAVLAELNTALPIGISAEPPEPWTLLEPPRPPVAPLKKPAVGFV